ncbi:MAG: tyrosine-type recombinase/integrase [Kiritimatiellae bacterium]|nr:tyrosine-type recombinase/integrase [Kiritimatiellia bacterium]
MGDISKPNGTSHTLLQKGVEFQSAMQKAGFAEATQKIYRRAFDKFTKRLDRKTPATATLKEAKRHLTELKQQGAKSAAYSTASAALRFFFEKVRGMEWKPISALQKRMVEDMCLHGFASSTQNSYVRAVTALACYYNKSPDLLNEEDLRKYFVHLTCERKLAQPTITIALCGIKFFYEKTLKRDWSLTGVPIPKRNKFLPVIISRQEVRLILSKIRLVRHSTCLKLIYACGLRLSEGCAVKVTDIDRGRMQLRVRGKGSKDRLVPIPPAMMPLLAECWRSHRNPVWLFPFVGRAGSHGADTDRHVPIATVQQVMRAAVIESGLTKKATVHSLRHAYATHLLEAGVGLRMIQRWMGHSSITMTAHYAQLTTQIKDASGKIVGALMADIGGLPG